MPGGEGRGVRKGGQRFMKLMFTYLKKNGNGGIRATGTSAEILTMTAIAVESLSVVIAEEKGISKKEALKFILNCFYEDIDALVAI